MIYEGLGLATRVLYCNNAIGFDFTRPSKCELRVQHSYSVVNFDPLINRFSVEYRLIDRGPRPERRTRLSSAEPSQFAGTRAHIRMGILSYQYHTISYQFRCHYQLINIQYHLSLFTFITISTSISISGWQSILIDFGVREQSRTSTRMFTSNARTVLCVYYIINNVVISVLRSLWCAALFVQ